MGRGGSFGGGSRGGFGGSFGGSRGGFGGSFGGSRGGSSFGGFGGSSFGSSNRSGGGSNFGLGGGYRGMGLGNSGSGFFGRSVMPGSARGCGCSSGFAVFIIIVIIAAFVLSFGSGDIFGGTGGGDVIPSTVVREPLPKGLVNETDYFTDNAGVITNQTKLVAGMKNFYQKTGVQPHVYLINNAEVSTSLETFTESLYSELFTDEAHLLLVLTFDNGDLSNYYCLPGGMTKTVMDKEAEDIFEQYLQAYYYDLSLTYEEFISKTFNDTANRIMSVTTSPWIPVLIVLGVLAVLILLFVWWRHAKKKKEEEARRTEEMLKTPLEKFGDSDDEAERLARKYDGNPDNDK